MNFTSQPLKITHKEFKKIKDLDLAEHKTLCRKQPNCQECILKYNDKTCVVNVLKSMKNDIDIHLNKEVEV